MAERQMISYHYDDLDSFEEHEEVVQKIIEEDTGEEAWYQTRSFPPIGIPPPLTTEAITKLKDLRGISIRVAEEDE